MTGGRTAKFVSRVQKHVGYNCLKFFLVRMCYVSVKYFFSCCTIIFVSVLCCFVGCLVWRGCLVGRGCLVWRGCWFGVVIWFGVVLIWFDTIIWFDVFVCSVCLFVWFGTVVWFGVLVGLAWLFVRLFGRVHAWLID